MFRNSQCFSDSQKDFFYPLTTKRHFSFVPHNRSVTILKSTMATNRFDHRGPDPKPLQPNSKRTNTSELLALTPRTGRSQLGVDFQPSKHSVICGRGKSSYDHTGNHYLRTLTSMFIADYSKAGTKLKKAAIVANIVAVIRQGGGGFCKYEKGAWFEVGDYYAREKVSAFFRDMLCNLYRSSSKARTARRRRAHRKQTETQPQQYGHQLVDYTGLVHLDDGAEYSDGDFSMPSLSFSGYDSLGFDYSQEVDFFDIDVFSD
jgi:hypothetical protein